MYQYKGKVTNVVDGDTVDIELDLGFDIKLTSRFRLNGIDAAETSSLYGKMTKAWLTMEIAGKKVIVNSYNHDKYGRWLADIFLMSPSGLLDYSINQQMIDAGVVKAYGGDTKSGLWLNEELTSKASQPITLELK